MREVKIELPKYIMKMCKWEEDDNYNMYDANFQLETILAEYNNETNTYEGLHEIKYYRKIEDYQNDNRPVKTVNTDYHRFTSDVFAFGDSRVKLYELSLSEYHKYRNDMVNDMTFLSCKLNNKEFATKNRFSNAPNYPEYIKVNTKGSNYNEQSFLKHLGGGFYNGLNINFYNGIIKSWEIIGSIDDFLNDDFEVVVVNKYLYNAGIKSIEDFSNES